MSNAHKAHELQTLATREPSSDHISHFWLALTLRPAECPAPWLSWLGRAEVWPVSLCSSPGICCRAGIHPWMWMQWLAIHFFCATSIHCLWVNSASGHWWHHLELDCSVIRFIFHELSPLFSYVNNKLCIWKWKKKKKPIPGRKIDSSLGKPKSTRH